MSLELKYQSAKVRDKHVLRAQVLVSKGPGQACLGNSGLIQPRLGTSMPRELRYQPHPRKSRLEPYSQ
jgi:hypothetical protein